MEFRNIKPGRIFYIGNRAFAKLRKPHGERPTEACCKGRSCTVSWNATNFANDVHICPSTWVEHTQYYYEEKED